MQKNTKILLAIVLMLFGVTALLLYFSAAVFLQLFIAFALAYVLNPAVSFLERKGIGRITSIIIVFSLSVAIFAGFAVFMVVSISNELSSMQFNLPVYAQRLYDLTPPTVKAYLGIETPDKLSVTMNDLLHRVRGISPDLLKPLLVFVQKAFSSTIALILTILGYLIIPVYLFYLLADLPRLKSFIESFVPERFRSSYSLKLEEIDWVLSGFVRGQISVCAILAVLYSAGLYVIGIDLAIAIGTLAGVTFIIPYVGTILGIILSVVMAILKFHDMIHPLLCLVWFGLVQTLEGTVITPKIVGDRVGLHPLVAIVALLIGGQMFGIMGMLVAVPVSAILQVFFRSLSCWYRESEFYRGC